MNPCEEYVNVVKNDGVCADRDCSRSSCRICYAEGAESKERCCVYSGKRNGDFRKAE